LFLFAPRGKFITCCAAKKEKDALHYFRLPEIESRAENRPAGIVLPEAEAIS
jgi:hypothetical protein